MSGSRIFLPGFLPAALVLSVSGICPVAGQDATGEQASGQANVAADAASTKQALSEQTIYIPYTKLKEVFEREGRGVFLPYEQFQTLWKAAREQRVSPAPQPPPIPAMLTSVENEAAVQMDVVQVQAKIRIEVLGEGWIRTPLRLADAAIRSATIGGQPARILPAPSGGYELLYEKKGKPPETIELLLEYAKAFNKTPGRNSVSFQAPMAPVNRWRIRVPQSGVKVDVRPMIATTEAPAGGQDAPQETVVMAFVGAAREVTVEWTPKAEGAAGLSALVTAKVDHEIQLEEGVLHTHADVHYSVSRAPLSTLTLSVPADQKVVNVFDPNIRQWEVKSGEQAQQIVVQLYEPVLGQQNITVELERFHELKTEHVLATPLVRADEAGRQDGVVVVRLGEGLRAEPTERAGLLQMDASELPDRWKTGRWDYSFRYATPAARLSLSVEKIQPRIEVRELAEVYLEPEQLTVELLALLNIERAGVFQLEFDIPPGFEIRGIRGQAVGEYQAVDYKSQQVSPDQPGRITVTLGRRAIDKVGIVLQLSQRLDDANLLTPTGQSSTISSPLPRARADSVDRIDGRLIVYSPESLQVSPAQVVAMRSISQAQALQEMQSMRENRFAAARPVLSFAYAMAPASLSLEVTRRRPQVNLDQLLLVQIEDGTINYDARYFYEARYSGISEVQIEIPAALADRIRNQSPEYRTLPLAPAPRDATPEHVVWAVRGDSELLGKFAFHWSWQEKLVNLDVGKTVTFTVPRLIARGVDRGRGQVVLAKSETIEIEATDAVTGMLPIDPQTDLIPGAEVSQGARAFEYHDAWSLQVAATRYQLEEIKRTSIERAVLQMVATRSEEISVQAVYRVRSSRQRLAVQLPAQATPDSQPLRINGEAAKLERGDQDQLYIPLANLTADKPFILELRFTMASTSGRFDIPYFPEDPAMQEVYLCAYLPDELDWIGNHGPWTEAMSWRRVTARQQRVRSRGAGPFWLWEPRPQKSAYNLLQWVSEGIVPVASLQGFPTDGRMYLFSAIRPPAPPNSALDLQSIRHQSLALFTVLAVAVIALVMALRPWRQRLAAVCLLVIALVLLGVFRPTLAYQILDGTLLAAFTAMLVLWVLISLVRAAKSRPARSPEPPSAQSIRDSFLRHTSLEGRLPGVSAAVSSAEASDTGEAGHE